MHLTKTINARQAEDIIKSATHPDEAEADILCIMKHNRVCFVGACQIANVEGRLEISGPDTDVEYWLGLTL